jgi:hypothetical protein
MSNFLKDILDAVKIEEIEAIYLIPYKESWRFGKDDEEGKDSYGVPLDLTRKSISFLEVMKYLNYEYYTGFGGQECHDFFIWTKNEVFTIHEYDGATSIMSIPRNPIKDGEI